MDTTSEDPGYSAFRAEPFKRTFLGKLEDKYPIVMDLESDGKTLKGSYHYEGKMGSTYSLEGSLQWSGAFSLTEKDAKGQLRSTFQGFFIDRYRMDGTWSAAEGEEPLPFFLLSSELLTGGSPSDIYNQPNDTVAGLPGLKIFHHAIYCQDCDCSVQVHYPQLEGVTTPDEQDAVNRHVRLRILEALHPGCEAAKTGDRWAETHTFRTGILTPYAFSGALYSPSQPSAGFLYDLHTGDFLSLEDITRDKKRLIVFLQHSMPNAEAEWDHLQVWMDNAGIQIFLPGSEPVTVPWSHPQLPSWFRDLPSFRNLPPQL